MNLSDRNLKSALARFEKLLSRRSTEKEWQILFTDCPYILSKSLPLKINHKDIVPLGRPGRSEADFVFYPRYPTSYPSYGVIEIKRPDSKIITMPRNQILTLTRDASTAIQQSKVYAKKLNKLMFSPSSSLILGNSTYLFVIMGLSEELTQVMTQDFLRAQLEDHIPSNLQLIPYDTLLENFARSLPAKIMCLVPASSFDRSILIMDDDPEINRHLVELFGTQYGTKIQIYKAFNAGEALGKIATNKPNVIITSLMMPYGNALHKLNGESDPDSIETGVRFLKHIRENIYNYFPWVAITTVRSNPKTLSIIKEMFNGRGRVYLKPYDTFELELDITTVLGIDCNVPNQLIPEDYNPPYVNYDL